jgi:hypothetical protein
MQKKIVTNPMKILSHNYWRPQNPHLVDKWLDVAQGKEKFKPFCSVRSTGNIWMQGKQRKVVDNLDTDSDGIPDDSDCEPLNPKKQHTKTWQKELQKQERLKRENADYIINQRKYGWTDEQIIKRLSKKSSSLDKISKRYEHVMSIPGAVGFSGEDIQRTKDVKQFIKDHNLKDYGSEIVIYE